MIWTFTDRDYRFRPSLGAPGGIPRLFASTSNVGSSRRPTGGAGLAAQASWHPYLDYLRELTATRLTREIRKRGYSGAYTAVKRYLAAVRPENVPKPFEVRFETPPGQQAHADFARFITAITDEPGVTRIIWLFSLVLDYSRHIFARLVCARICRRC